LPRVQQPIHAKLRKRKDGRHADRIKSEGWVFPASFVSKQLQTSAKQLLVTEVEGDSMAPTIMPGEKICRRHRSQNAIARWALCHSRFI
jgi:hypothetical protein